MGINIQAILLPVAGMASADDRADLIAYLLKTSK
jgi:cytochrome c2